MQNHYTIPTLSNWKDQCPVHFLLRNARVIITRVKRNAAGYLVPTHYFTLN